jgi:hypothetical protein
LYVRLFSVVENLRNLMDNDTKHMGEQKAPCIEIGIEPRYHDNLRGLFEILGRKSDWTLAIHAGRKNA